LGIVDKVIAFLVTDGMMVFRQVQQGVSMLHEAKTGLAQTCLAKRAQERARILCHVAQGRRSMPDQRRLELQMSSGVTVILTGQEAEDVLLELVREKVINLGLEDASAD